MARVKVSTDSNGRKQLEVRYNQSRLFDSSHYIHKYYLSNEDKGLFFPADIYALEFMTDVFSEAPLPDNPPEITIAYYDNGLEKRVHSDLFLRGLLAISQYYRDCNAKLTPAELRAALNLNEWLRGYEKTLLSRQLGLEKELKGGLRGSDPFLTDYEIDLDIDFYVRDDDPWCENENANEHDWDVDAALMCTLKGVGAYTSRRRVNEPDYFGLGDDQNHNDCGNINHPNPVYREKHCYLFHELTSHCGVPFKHLIRIGLISAEFIVRYQNMVDIDLTGEKIDARQEDAWQRKLERCP